MSLEGMLILVYEDETGIRNNLVGLLIAKINIFKQQQITCYEWQPSKQLLKSAKSATYRNLTAAAKENELVNQLQPVFPFSSPRKLQKVSKFFKVFSGLIEGTLAQHG